MLASVLRSGLRQRASAAARSFGPSRTCRQWQSTAPRRAAVDAAPASETAKAGGAAAVAGGFSYVAFAQANPITNNFIIATVKTSAADLVTQTVIEKKSFKEIDWARNSVFCLFGFAYLGGFQYLYQVNVFKRLFPGIEKFTSQSVAKKLTDLPGLMALGAQTVLDVGVLCTLYLPTFYVFKASVFSDSNDPTQWFATGINNYKNNISSDAWDVFRVWAPADLVCFSVPLWLRLPVRHIVSFVWTSYLSFIRGGKKD